MGPVVCLFLQSLFDWHFGMERWSNDGNFINGFWIGFYGKISVMYFEDKKNDGV
jgi:hypothetical protein